MSKVILKFVVAELVSKAISAEGVIDIFDMQGEDCHYAHHLRQIQNVVTAAKK